MCVQQVSGKTDWTTGGHGESAAHTDLALWEMYSSAYLHGGFLGVVLYVLYVVVAVVAARQHVRNAPRIDCRLTSHATGRDTTTQLVT